MPRKLTQPNKGAAMMVFVVFFLFASTTMVLLFLNSVFADLRILTTLGASKQSHVLSEALTEDIAFRYIFGTYSVATTETLTYFGGVAHATATEDTINDEIAINTTADVHNRIRKSEVILTIAGGTAFNYGLQAGTGGITLANSAGITGNVYANGPIIGGGSSLIKGDVVSAGPSGLISNVHATGSSWSDTLDDSLIEKDAHYNNVATPSVVNGTRYTPHPNEPEVDLPISTTTVEEWKQVVIDHGTVIAASDPECSSGEYTVTGSVPLGYVKIECDVNIRDNSTVLTMDGPIWVEGNLAFTQSPEIRVDPSVGRFSTQFIVDNESDRLTSSKVEVRHSTNFVGSGHPNSFIMVLSRNESAESGGPEVAIKVSNKADGAVMMYAGQGLVEVANNIELKELTAHQIDAGNNVEIIYDSGLQNQLFTSGPGGSYSIDSWHEDF